MENVEKIEFRENLKIRLRQFVLGLIKLCKSLPREEDAIILKNSFSALVVKFMQITEQPTEHVQKLNSSVN